MTSAKPLQNVTDAAYQLLVTFPYSALTIPRQQTFTPPTKSNDTNTDTADTMKSQKSFEAIDDRVLDLCTSTDTVSSLLAKDPTLEPGEAWKKLYAHHVLKPKGAKKVDGAGQATLGPGELLKAKKCGNWGPTEPSELFLQVRD